MRGAGDAPERVFATDGTIRSARKLVRRSDAMTQADATMPDRIAERITRLATDVERLQRSARGASALYQLSVDGGGAGVQTFGMRHDLGGDIIVTLVCVATTYAGVVATDMVYRTDLSDDSTAWVMLSNATGQDYTATVRVEAV
jgi:hypothetical protein